MWFGTYQQSLQTVNRAITQPLLTEEFCPTEGVGTQVIARKGSCFGRQ